jgi:uncharacterized protein YjbI with pentapeptide repeats
VEEIKNSLQDGCYTSPIVADDSKKQADKNIDPGCPIQMGGRNAIQCGRAILGAPAGSDEKPVCLMHSKNLNKQSGPLFDTFWKEFEKILADAGKATANFEGFVFPKADFRGRKFDAKCNFGSAVFAQTAIFSRAAFKQGADFSNAVFTEDADFNGAIFLQQIHFTAVSFAGDALFGGAIYIEDADFSGAEFAGEAQFSGAVFKQAVRFSYASFARQARFADTQFYGTASWNRCAFLDLAEFRRTNFDPQIEGEPSAVFSQAEFSKPGEIIFDDVDLSCALFHNCDVSEIWFTSSARWGARGNHRGLAVFEETIPFKHDFARRLERGGQRDYGAIAQIYQQLKKNYDARLDYWTANEFHFGEMEMKRLAVLTKGPLLGLRKWFQPRLSLVAFYCWFSDYGNSYWKPMAWLLATLFLFAALLPLPGVGLKREKANHAETYLSVWRVQDGWTPNLWAEARLAGKAAITSVDSATFQKSAEYTPAYPWGRVLAILETLLTSTLFALFLLAIRRQFRR